MWSTQLFSTSQKSMLTHNIYQYVNKEQGKKITMQWKQTKHTNKKRTSQAK
jgi:hypothetical protein